MAIGLKAEEIDKQVSKEKCRHEVLKLRQVGNGFIAGIADPDRGSPGRGSRFEERGRGSAARERHIKARECRVAAGECAVETGECVVETGGR
jgi:hypothetical protein